MNEKTNTSVHWSFWVVGAVALLWNLMGAMNFSMQMNAEIVATMPESYRTLIETRATWVTGAFGVAVLGGASGSLLLLFKKSVAFYFFIASLLGGLVQIIPTIKIGNIESAVGTGAFMLVVAFLIWYSKMAENKGWIR